MLRKCLVSPPNLLLLRWFLGLLLLSGSSGCDRGGESPIVFRDVTDKSGVRFRHFQSKRNSLLPEDVGSGAAWGDYDNDGDDDLFLVNFSTGVLGGEGTRTNRLYRNEGGFQFKDVTDESGLVMSDWNLGCLWWDYNGDGRLDLAISHLRGLSLYRNSGEGVFEDVTGEAGLAEYQGFYLGLSAADYDQDGDLDLYVCGYVRFDRDAAARRPMVGGRPESWTNPVSFPAEPNRLFRNNGGTFEDVAELAGVADPKGKSMQALFVDLNNDRFPDLYVGNDVSTPDALFLNRGDGSFENQAGLAGVLDYRAGMGIAVADFWNRGWLDLVVTHWVAEDHAFWRNVSMDSSDEGRVIFEDWAPRLGLTPKPSADVGWGCGLIDFDNDGYRDLLVVNGSTIEDELTEEVLSNPKLIPQKNVLHRWDVPENRFVDVSSLSGAHFSHHGVGRAAAFSDVDGDGRVDVVVTYNGGEAVVLRNESTSGHYLQVRAVGAGGNRHAIGARVRVHVGGEVMMQPIVCGSSYLGNNSVVVHFGLGESTLVDRVEVEFPSGKIVARNRVRVNQRIEIAEK